jgi:hypothetical protein
MLSWKVCYSEAAKFFSRKRNRWRKVGIGPGSIYTRIVTGVGFLIFDYFEVAAALKGITGACYC